MESNWICCWSFDKEERRGYWRRRSKSVVVIISILLIWQISAGYDCYFEEKFNLVNNMCEVEDEQCMCREEGCFLFFFNLDRWNNFFHMSHICALDWKNWSIK
jgi:hypothetical protein